MRLSATASSFSYGLFIIHGDKKKAVVLPQVKRVRSGALEHSHVPVPCLAAQSLGSNWTVNWGQQ